MYANNLHGADQTVLSHTLEQPDALCFCKSKLSRALNLLARCSASPMYGVIRQQPANVMMYCSSFRNSRGLTVWQTAESPIMPYQHCACTYPS